MYSILSSTARTHARDGRKTAHRGIHGATREPRALSLSLVWRKKSQQGGLCPADDAIGSKCRDVSLHGVRPQRCEKACAIAGICRVVRLHGARTRPLKMQQTTQQTSFFAASCAFFASSCALCIFSLSWCTSSRSAAFSSSNLRTWSCALRTCTPSSSSPAQATKHKQLPPAAVPAFAVARRLLQLLRLLRQSRPAAVHRRWLQPAGPLHFLVPSLSAFPSCVVFKKNGKNVTDKMLFVGRCNSCTSNRSFFCPRERVHFFVLVKG